MALLRNVLAERGDLDDGARIHLRRLGMEWQLVADLSFADLLLWLPAGEGRVICIGQVRPTTGPTAHAEDLIGRVRPLRSYGPLGVALREQRIFRESDPDWYGDIPVRREAVPVCHDGSIIGVVSRETNLNGARSPSLLELAYLQAAGDLCEMIAEGSFPPPMDDPEAPAGPRAGDGLIRLDAAGTVSYLSPNAFSAYRRLGATGDLRLAHLSNVTRALADDTLQGRAAADAIESVLAGGVPQRAEVRADGVSVRLRALPLFVQGRSRGALVLIRDVTDVRHRDRQLMSKDATIREINHRVKNNLQTVAALLRMQARRVETPEARTALADSVRRISAIAEVHEMLALSVDDSLDGDDVVNRLTRMMTEVSSADRTVAFRRTGELGELGADIATPLAMVLTELLQNAVEHAFAPGRGGTVTVDAARTSNCLRVTVSDDGIGLPPGFTVAGSDRLGLRIVDVLVNSELRGTVAMTTADSGGTRATIELPLDGKDGPPG